MPFPPMLDGISSNKENDSSKKTKEDPNLRSTHNVKGYNIQYND